MTATQAASDFRGGRGADAEKPFEVRLEVLIGEVEHLRQHDDVVMAYFDAGTDRCSPNVAHEGQIAAQHRLVAERGMADDGRVLADLQAHCVGVELDRLSYVVLHRVPCGVAHGENVGKVPSDLEVLAYVGGR